MSVCISDETGSASGEVITPRDPTSGVGSVAWRSWLWTHVGSRLFRLSFHNAYHFRNRILRAFGASIDPTARLRPTCRVDRPWNLTMRYKSVCGDGVVVWAHGPVTIGERSVLSQYAIVAAWKDDRSPVSGRTEPASVTFGHDVWIATECFVPGGVTVPDGVVVGARSVVGNGLEPWTIAAGDPARSRRARPFDGPKSDLKPDNARVDPVAGGQ